MIVHKVTCYILIWSSGPSQRFQIEFDFCSRWTQKKKKKNSQSEIQCSEGAEQDCKGSNSSWIWKFGEKKKKKIVLLYALNDWIWSNVCIYSFWERNIEMSVPLISTIIKWKAHNWTKKKNFSLLVAKKQVNAFLLYPALVFQFSRLSSVYAR